MNNPIGRFIRWAKDNDWHVIESSGAPLTLPVSIVSRYGEAPEEYAAFLSAVKQCVSPKGETWFLCQDEYNGNSDSPFLWNEFESLSLEAAGDDAKWRSEITAWWDQYLPIVMSVDGGYSFYAIALTHNPGAVVRGYEPEFEEVEEVAPTFGHFLEGIMSRSIEVL